MDAHDYVEDCECHDCLHVTVRQLRDELDGLRVQKPAFWYVPAEGDDDEDALLLPNRDGKCPSSYTTVRAYPLYAQPVAAPAVPDDVRRDAEVGAAIERAAKELPPNYFIEIEIENGAATVRLYDDECARLGYDADGANLAGEIRTAIDAAMLAAAQGGKP